MPSETFGHEKAILNSSYQLSTAGWSRREKAEERASLHQAFRTTEGLGLGSWKIKNVFASGLLKDMQYKMNQRLYQGC